MQLAALRYFLETARLGSIRQAAERLNVAPSAISRQIAQLENTYGMPFLERSAAGVRLTEAGRVFVKQAKATIRDFERLQFEIDDLQQLRRGTVRIVTVWGTASSVVYPAVADFSREYPGITFEVRVLNGGQVIAALVAEECDIAIGFEPPPHQDIEEVQSLSDPIVAIFPPNHPLASQDKVSLRELAEHPVALPDDTTRRLLDRALALEGITLQPRITFNGIGLAATCALTNQIACIAPSLVVRNAVEEGLLTTALIDHPALPVTRFVLCHHKTRPPTIPALAFMTALQRQFTAYDLELHAKRSAS